MTAIRLHAAAPQKPAFGAPCNGCGVCCALTPCPLSRLSLRHRDGSCPALTWQGERYVCGLVVAPQGFIRWLPRRLRLRWIGVGWGCDCDAEIASDVL
ncbi:MAG: hypothetical protein ACK4E4_03430 [Rhodocyclaceae bacterium]